MRWLHSLRRVVEPECKLFKNKKQMNFIKNINIIRRNEATVFRGRLFFCIALFFVVLFYSALFTEIAKANELGESQEFLIDSSYDNNNRSEIAALLKNISANAYFYVENDFYNNLNSNSKFNFSINLNSLATSFDNIIYPKTRALFGSEWNPGIDDDSKITILFTKTKENIGGYFNPNNEYKKENISGGKSNEREMVYLNVAFMDDQRIESFLAHEFQHMITWNYKTKLNGISDDVWLNEGRSEYVSTAIGYDDNYPNSNLKARVDNFLKDQTDSLLEWKNEVSDYSSVNLFSQYLADRFGKTIFKLMISNNKTGVESINNALVDLNRSNINFRNIFTDWTIANYLNDKALSAGNRYGYFNPNLSYKNFHLSPTKSYKIDDSSKINFTSSLKDWSYEYHEFKAFENSYQKNILEINFNGDDTGYFSVPYIVFYKDGTKKVNYLDLNKNQDDRLTMTDFGINISSVLLIPSSQKEIDNQVNFKNYSFSVSAETVAKKTQSDRSLLKSLKNPEIYFIENNKKRWIINADAFVSNGYRWKDVVLVLENELEIFENGENIYALNLNLKQDGSLVKGSGFEVYLIENRNKKWITSEKVFINLGYNWDNIILISDEELDLYAEGEGVI